VACGTDFIFWLGPGVLPWWTLEFGKVTPGVWVLRGVAGVAVKINYFLAK